MSNHSQRRIAGNLEEPGRGVGGALEVGSRDVGALQNSVTPLDGGQRVPTDEGESKRQRRNRKGRFPEQG